MEEHLKRLVEHVESKPSFNVIVSDRTSRIHTIFNPPLVFPAEACNYEMALIKLETYYSFANIRPSNSSLKVSIDKGVTWKMIKIPTGCYEITAINKTLQKLIVDQVGGEAEKITVSPNTNTLKCILDITDKNYVIDFTIENCLRTVLGFDAKMYKYGEHESQHLVNIMSVNSILVNCDIIGASRLNGIEAPVIYNFFPNVAPGDKIVETPMNLTYVPITLNIISRMVSWLTDEDGNELDLRGEKLTISYHLRAC